MRKLVFILAIAAIFSSCKKADNQPSSVEVKATWSSSAQWGTCSNGGYTLYNNILCAGARPQVIWANSYIYWGVWADHPNTGGIKSYPNNTTYVVRTLSILGSCTRNFNITT